MPSRSCRWYTAWDRKTELTGLHCLHFGFSMAGGLALTLALCGSSPRTTQCGKTSSSECASRGCFSMLFLDILHCRHWIHGVRTMLLGCQSVHLSNWYAFRLYTLIQLPSGSLTLQCFRLSVRWRYLQWCRCIGVSSHSCE